MSWSVFILVSCLKVLFIPSYKSTDFEVHRNWLAITHSLPYNKWYTESTSPWTLDYPPFFAWFEFLLSQVAKYVDPAMLRVDNLDYSSWNTVLFQRLSVIGTDLVLFLGVTSLANSLPRASSEKLGGRYSRGGVLTWLVLSNAGLFMVDHIHFQYNGFLTGVLLLCLAALARDRALQAALWFTVLLNLKHIYLYYAPAVGLFLLRSHCLGSTKDGGVLLGSFTIFRLLSLGFVVLATTAASLGPFLWAGQGIQLLSRLFPFRRGLCHAYWAPNAWVIYNLGDKVLELVARKQGLITTPPTPGSMTGGLVQDISHVVLPSVSPLATGVVTLLAMVPALAKLWLTPHSFPAFLRCLTLCGWSSFLFGWHVHEKAILLVVIPLAVVAVTSRAQAKEANYYVITALTGHLSLFPLLFQPQELPTKLLLHLSHSLLALEVLPLAQFCWLDKTYLLLSLPVFLYSEFVHSALGLDMSLPFLPLLLYSAYCSLGVITTYLRFYVSFLRS